MHLATQRLKSSFALVSHVRVLAGPVGSESTPCFQCVRATVSTVPKESTETRDLRKVHHSRRVPEVPYKHNWKPQESKS